MAYGAGENGSERETEAERDATAKLRDIEARLLSKYEAGIAWKRSPKAWSSLCGTITNLVSSRRGLSVYWSKWRKGTRRDEKMGVFVEAHTRRSMMGMTLGGLAAGWSFDALSADRSLPPPFGKGWVNIATGEPQIPVNRVDAPRLTPELISELKSWRNGYGQPWTCWGHEFKQNLESKYLHSIRYHIGHLFMTLEVSDIFVSAELKQVGIDYFPPNPGWGYPDKPSRLKAERWYRQYVSEIGTNHDVGDCFAWYTAPDYTSGHLPNEIEAVLEQMTRAEHPGVTRTKRLLGGNLRSLLETLDLLRSGAYPRERVPENPVIGLDVVRFLIENKRL